MVMIAPGMKIDTIEIKVVHLIKKFNVDNQKVDYSKTWTTIFV